MKKTLGISVLSAMLILGQPIMAFADVTVPESKIVQFQDIESIIVEHNLEVRINENDRQDSNVGLASLKRDLKKMNDRIDDINDQMGESSDITVRIALTTEKRALVANVKVLERNLADMPTSVSSTDVAATMSDDQQVRLAESAYIMHNMLDLAIADISLSIDTLEDQLNVMQVRETLGVVTHTNVDDLKTKLVDLHTQLESNKLQQDLAERQFKDLINSQDDSLEIGKLPITDEAFAVKDKDDDVKKAGENSYAIKLQQEKIVILKATLDRAEKDNGLSSAEYKHAKIDLDSAYLVLSQLKDKVTSDYSTVVDDIAKKQSNLRLEEQKLEDKRVAMNEAQLKLSLGVITQLDLNSIVTDFQLQGDVVQTNKINLFTAINSYDWLLQGMPYSA
ncbi:MAG TPA: TolC family protein [Desulfosporosinus sp.]|nr:TolC family protein [Desulfosporosinus sp.]